MRERNGMWRGGTSEEIKNIISPPYLYCSENHHFTKQILS
jgi:hypothetical protein